MEEFKVVMQILYKENKYLILLNTRHQKYFLKILDDEKFMYPTMQEFTELYNIFEKNEIMFFLMKKQKSYNNKCEKFLKSLMGFEIRK